MRENVLKINRSIARTDWSLSRLMLWSAAFYLLMSPAMAADNAVLKQAQKAAQQWRLSHEQQIIDEFVELLAVPNFGGRPDEIENNAEHIVTLLEQHNIPAKILRAPPSNPAVYGEIVNPKAERTITLYVHYDGQPTSEDLWASPPFQPVLRTGKLEQGGEIVDWEGLTYPLNPEWRLYARSAGDDKAPIIALLAAIEALRDQQILPAVNVKFFFEGEEEIGSPNLRHMLMTHRTLLASDLWLFLDGPIDQSGLQSLNFGVRGVTGVDITVFGPEHGLHSGHYGNFAPNPIARLVDLLGSMRSENGQILIKGFEDELVELTPAERELVLRTPSKNEWLAKDLGIASPERPEERYEFSLLRPALNFKGIRAGEVGEKSRNVIVPSATASIGFRLVPAQSLAQVQKTVEAHIAAQGYRVIHRLPTHEQRLMHDKWALVEWEKAGYPAVRTALDEAPAQALIELMNTINDGELVLSPSLGGSLPLAHIADTLNVPIALLPIANHDNNQHAPNENIRLGHLWRAIETYAALLAGLNW